MIVTPFRSSPNETTLRNRNSLRDGPGWERLRRPRGKCRFTMAARTGWSTSPTRSRLRRSCGTKECGPIRTGRKGRDTDSRGPICSTRRRGGCPGSGRCSLWRNIYDCEAGTAHARRVHRAAIPPSAFWSGTRCWGRLRGSTVRSRSTWIPTPKSTPIWRRGGGSGKPPPVLR